MKINFVLLEPKRRPSGGYKMVYEYANRLSARGHEVAIIFNCYEDWQRRSKVPDFIKYLWYHLRVKYLPRWFSLNPNVKKICSYKVVNETVVPEADIVCATAVSTASFVSSLPQSKGKKMYFIQGFEAWGDWTPEMVKRTYHLGLKNVVIAKWLQKILKEADAECVLIPNGIDFDVFNIDIPIASRRKHVISMLYHVSPHKGSKYGVEAIIRLKQKYTDLQAIIFGARKRPENLPTWIQYVQNASQKQLREIYNRSTVYLYPSIKEGFGLTGAEAMACGAAYVASDYGGVHEYTENARNVLLSPPKDADGLVKNVTYLFEHDDKRIELAQHGYEDIQRLDWNKSVDKFEAVMQELVES